MLYVQGQVKSKIFEAQQQLERQQRREEDELMKEFWVNNSVDLKVGLVSHRIQNIKVLFHLKLHLQEKNEV